MEHFDLLSYFTLVGGADMEEIRVRKGDVIAYTLDRLGTTPEESKVIMVGDRKHDIIGAHENQLPCAAVLYGYGSREEFTENGADYQIETDGRAGRFPDEVGRSIKDKKELLKRDREMDNLNSNNLTALSENGT